jgi:hypothetical protein
MCLRILSHGLAVRPTQTLQTTAIHTTVYMYNANLHAAGLRDMAFFGGGGHFAASWTMRIPSSACLSSGGKRST